MSGRPVRRLTVGVFCGLLGTMIIVGMGIEPTTLTTLMILWDIHGDILDI
jgi:hypothetical protein